MPMAACDPKRPLPGKSLETGRRIPKDRKFLPSVRRNGRGCGVSGVGEWCSLL